MPKETFGVDLLVTVGLISQQRRNNQLYTVFSQPLNLYICKTCKTLSLFNPHSFPN